MWTPRALMYTGLFICTLGGGLSIACFFLPDPMLIAMVLPFALAGTIAIGAGRTLESQEARIAELERRLNEPT